MNNGRLVSLFTARPYLRITIAIGSLFVYLATFFQTYSWIGWGSVALVVLPVVVVGSLFGLRAGVLVALLSLPLNTLLLNLAGYQSGGWDVAIRGGGALGHLTLVAIGAVVGQLHDSRAQLPRDSAEHRLTSERLRDSEERYRLIAGTAGDAIITIDHHSRILLATSATEKIFGYAPVELIGQLLTRLMPEAEGQRHLSSLEKYLATGERHINWTNVHVKGRHRDGHEIQLEISFSERIQADKHVFAGSVRDVTERTRAEQALRLSELRFRALVENGFDGLTLLDDHGTIIYYSPSNERITGYTSEQREGQAGLAHVHPDDRDRVGNSLRAMAQIPDMIQRGVYRIRHKNGSWRWVEGVSQNRLAEPGVQAIVVNIRDVTERELAQEAEREQRTLAEALRDTATALNSTLSLDQVLERIIQNVGRVVPYDSVTIILIEAGVGHIVRQHGYEQLGLSHLLKRPFVIPEFPILRRMTETQQPAIISDTRTDADWIPLPGTHLIRSHLGAPIKTKGDVGGFLNLTSSVPDFFTPAHAARLQAFADQASIALENARLVEEIERRAADSVALYEITRDLTSTLDLPSLLKTIVGRASKLLKAPQGNIYLYDPVADELELTVANYEPAPLGLRLKRHEGMAGRILESRQVIIVNDYQTWEYRSPKFDRDLTHAAIKVPMIYRGELIGVLGVHDSGERTHTFGTLDVQLLSLFAAQAAGAIHSARLLAETERRATELAALYETTRDLATEQELPALLETIVERATTLLHAPGGFMFLYEPTKDHLKLAVSKHNPADVGATLRMGEGMAGHVAQTRQPLIVNDYQTWEHHLPNVPVKSAMQVPMLHRGELIGVLDVHELDTLRTFTEREMRLLTLFAAHAASAVQNARLLTETHQRAREFEMLYQVTNGLGAQSSLSAVLQTILERATEIVQVPDGTMYLYDAEADKLTTAANKGLPIPIGLRLGADTGASGYVARTRQTIIIDDYQTWEGRRPEYEGLPIRALLQVPILHYGELIGVLSVSENGVSERKFTEKDAQILTLLANQAAHAIHRSRSYEETRLRLAELEAINRVSTALRAAQSLSEMLPRLLDEVLAILNTDTGNIFIYDARLESITQDLARGWFAGLPRAEPGPREGITGYVLATGRPYITHEFSTDPFTSAEGRQLIPRGWSGVCLPIRAGKETVGVIFTAVQLPREIHHSEVSLLITLAEIAGNAIQRTRLQDAMQKRLNELETVNHISAALRVAQTLDEMLPRLLDETLNVFGTDAGAIWLYDPDKAELQQVIARGWRSQVKEPPMKPGEGIGGTVFATGEAYVSREFARDQLTRTAMRDLMQEGWGGAGVPISASQEVVGVLFVSVRLPREITTEEVGLLTTLAEIAGNAFHRTRLHESLQETYAETVLTLVNAIDARDNYTGGHSDRLAELAVAVAREMGLGKEEVETIRLAALLHDIGKIGVPDHILNKPTALAKDEWDQIRQHPVIGASIIQPVQRLNRVVPIVRHHQEYYDGSGYPDGLAGEEIPLGARILAVVDAFGAMIDDRVYRKGRPQEEALKELKLLSGQQFDPRVVHAFKRALEARSQAALNPP